MEFNRRPIPVDGPSESTRDRPEAETPKEIYEVSIGILDHGFMVRVGCKKFAIETSEKLLAKLDAYLTNPVVTIKEYKRTGTI